MAEDRGVGHDGFDKDDNGTPISPNYYKGFTNGAQPIDITEHLTGNAAQAVQYLTRACRVDGVTKSDPIEDVEKCIFFAQRELARLERERDSRIVTGKREVTYQFNVTSADSRNWHNLGFISDPDN